MKKRYLDELEDLGRSAWMDDCKTIDDIRNRIKKIFKKERDDFFLRAELKRSKREDREQLNAQ